MATIIFKETQKAGLALGPDRWNKAVKQTAYTIAEIITQKAKEYSQSKTLSGGYGGEGGISGHIFFGSKIKINISATARNRQTGYNWASVREFGSGIFGIKKSPIFPRKSKVLAWLKDGKPNPLTPAGWKLERQKNNVAIARKVQGQPGNLFLKRAFEFGQNRLESVLQLRIDSLNRES